MRFLRMHELIYGQTIPSSIIVTGTRNQSSACLDLLENGVPFQTVAIEHSIDVSANQGGVVNPISLVDSAWPAPIREQLSFLVLDEVSKPIFIGDRWVIIKKTGEPTSSHVLFENVKEDMKALATQAQERILMDTFEAELKSRSKITPIDKNLSTN